MTPEYPGGYNHKLTLLVRTSLAGVALLLLASCGDAESAPDDTRAEAASLVVRDAWVRATTGTDDPSMTGAFMVLENDGDGVLTLTGAASPVAKMVELHEMAMVDGKMAMQQIDGGIGVAGGEDAVLEPGGNHVMLMGLSEELAVGDEVEVTLELSDGSTVDLTAPVKAFTEEEPHYHESNDASPSGEMSPSE